MPVTPPATATDRSRTAQLCKALGDETRLRVIELLRGGELCVCDIQAGIGISQSLLSFHLRVLRDAELVTDRRAGRWAFYSLSSEALDTLTEAIDALRARAASASSAPCCT